MKVSLESMPFEGDYNGVSSEWMPLEGEIIKVHHLWCLLREY